MAIVTAMAAMCGAGVGFGLVVAWSAWRGQRLESLSLDLLRHRTDRMAGRAGIAIGTGVLVGVGTGWPVGALLAGGAVVALPPLLRSQDDVKTAVARAEALAAWTEMLRDTMAGAAGLEQAIAATSEIAPEAIRAQTLALAARLDHQRLVPALRAFADDLADPTADLVVAALIVAAGTHAGRLGDLLGALARAARDEATMRLRVEAGRARTRTAVRVVVGSTTAMAVGLLLLNRSYLDAYDSAAGQLMLLLVGACFAAAFWWLSRMTQAPRPARILAEAVP